jgi:hypothetical protein
MKVYNKIGLGVGKYQKERKKTGKFFFTKKGGILSLSTCGITWSYYYPE